ncbi:DNA-binding protein [Methylobacterium sp. J-078]|uniref:DNA-binding protein n=1 Tax=Methylobacterium sp. J-078 TaxID=2836657 RepID=UPI001FB8C046|nr:DNA-binding protein [Methylobacterium sp. J-078]MCJ2046372.1 DNA-binding protein [Methylobacterium sp. J-078]
MPTELSVFMVADAMLARGEKPSLRKVRERLATGGSPREVCKHLRAWRKKRGYDPKLEPTDMSKGMKAAAQALGMDLWKMAKREATQTFSREREQAKADQAGEKEDREHLLGMIETLQAENAALKAKGAAADQDGERLQARLAKVENQLERFRAEEFWDRVMQEVHDIIPDGSAMTPAEILPEIRTWTVRGAALHKEPLTPGVLKKKMDVRIKHGKYFEAQPQGRYGRRTA